MPLKFFFVFIPFGFISLFMALCAFLLISWFWRISRIRFEFHHHHHCAFRFRFHSLWVFFFCLFIYLLCEEETCNRKSREIWILISIKKWIYQIKWIIPTDFFLLFYWSWRRRQKESHLNSLFNWIPHFQAKWIFDAIHYASKHPTNTSISFTSFDFNPSFHLS